MAARNLFSILHEGNCASDGDFQVQWFFESVVLKRICDSKELFKGSEKDLKNWLKERGITEDYWIQVRCPVLWPWSGH